MRQGKYQRAFEETESLLRLRPNDSDARTAAAVLKAASLSGEQRVTHPGPAHVPWVEPGKSLTIPVSIEGKEVKYFFDTGSNLSIISDEGAHRVGLTVGDANVAVRNSTGKQAVFRMATAGRFQIGDCHLNTLHFWFPPRGNRLSMTCRHCTRG